MTENALTARRKMNITMKTGKETIKENQSLLSSLDDLENKIVRDGGDIETCNQRNHLKTKRKGKKYGGHR